MCEHDHGAAESPHRHDHRERAVLDTSTGVDPSVTRRTVVGGTIGIAVGVAGCLQGETGSGGDNDVPQPVTLTTEDACDVCGMIIPNHPGPSAEIFYENQTPTGHADPAHFCSTWEAFQYDFERQEEGWTRQVFYVTDYSTVDYDLFEDGGTTFISKHVQAGDFVDATTVTFVVGSEVKGAMGADLVGFSKRADAEQFKRDHGGKLAAFEDVTEATIAQLGN